MDGAEARLVGSQSQDRPFFELHRQDGISDADFPPTTAQQHRHPQRRGDGNGEAEDDFNPRGLQGRQNNSALAGGRSSQGRSGEDSSSGSGSRSSGKSGRGNIPDDYDDDDDDDDEDQDNPGQVERKPLLAQPVRRTASGEFMLSDFSSSGSGQRASPHHSMPSLGQGPVQAQTSLSTASSALSLALSARQPSKAASMSNGLDARRKPKGKRRKKPWASETDLQLQRGSSLNKSSSNVDGSANGEGADSAQAVMQLAPAAQQEKDKQVVVSIEKLEHELAQLRALCAPHNIDGSGDRAGDKKSRRRRRWISRRLTHRLLLMTIIWQVRSIVLVLCCAVLCCAVLCCAVCLVLLFASQPTQSTAVANYLFSHLLALACTHSSRLFALLLLLLFVRS